MPLFPLLFKSQQTHSAPLAVPWMRDDRAAERFDVCQCVSIGLPGDVVVTGSMINISVTGAAIRVDGWNTSRTEWLAGLDQGDELWVEGILLGGLISCWVVVSDGGLLRVHFSRDEAQRRQLRVAIARLAAPTA